MKDGTQNIVGCKFKKEVEEAEKLVEWVMLEPIGDTAEQCRQMHNIEELHTKTETNGVCASNENGQKFAFHFI